MIYIIPIVFFLIYVCTFYLLDKRDKEPISLVLSICIYGAFSALFVCRYILPGANLFNISFVEETIKFIIVIILFHSLSKYVNNSFDLIVYSCYSALGFSIAESLYYLYLNPSLSLALSRSIFSVLHCIWTTICAYGFSISVSLSNPIFSIVGITLAIFLHTLHNYLALFSFNYIYIFFFILQVFALFIIFNNLISREIKIISLYKSKDLSNSHILEIYELEQKNKYITSRLKYLYALTKSLH
jgi:RsiW-degrading membrane proteinase PrsW (M82 family)